MGVNHPRWNGGRYLTPEEVVHHDDNDPGNNKDANLILFANQAEHKKYHNQFRKRNSNGTFAQSH